MKNITFNKKCNGVTLGRELMAAGFDVIGVSTIDDEKNNIHKAVVHLEDSELKNPASVVNLHVFKDMDTVIAADSAAAKAAITAEIDGLVTTSDVKGYLKKIKGVV